MSKVELDAFNETRTCTYKTIVLQQFKIYVYTFYARELLYQIKIKWKINVYKVNIMIVTPQFKYFKYGILFYFTTKFRILTGNCACIRVPYNCQYPISSNMISVWIIRV